jgi:hypothetical protein
MTELPLRLPSYAAVRARLRIGSISFHVRRAVQHSTIYATSVIVCPGDTPDDSVIALNGLLHGLAHVVSWSWLDPEGEDGDCIQCWLEADANQSFS